MSGKILVAISETKPREQFKAILKHTPYDVHYIDIKENAAEVFSSLTPDIVIADIEFTERLLAQLGQTNRREVPIICYIKEYNARLAYDLLKKGAYDCIADPLRQTEILGIISKSLERDILTIEKVERQTLFDYISALPSKNKISLGALAIGVVVLVLFLVYKVVAPPSPKRFIEVPHYHITGVIGGERTVFLSDWFTQAIYRYSRVSGELIGVYYFSDFAPLGIATDGEVIWSIGADQKVRLHQFNETAKELETINVIPIDIASPGGICIEDKTLWVTDSQLNKIYQYEITRSYRQKDVLKFKSEYTTGGISPSGIWKVLGHIFIIDSPTGALISGIISEGRFIPKKESPVRKANEKVVAIGGSSHKDIFIALRGVEGDKTVLRNIHLKKL